MGSLPVEVVVGDDPKVGPSAGGTRALALPLAFTLALAEALGDKAVLLLPAHGFVAVAPNLQSAVFRAIFTEVSARVQLQAATLGGPMAALDEEEGRKADAINLATVGRSWELWKSRVLAPARVHHGEDEE